MQRERKREQVAVKPFKPKSYKELVDWFVVQIDSGTATKRDFVRLAAGLANLPKKVKAPAKKVEPKKVPKPKDLGKLE